MVTETPTRIVRRLPDTVVVRRLRFLMRRAEPTTAVSGVTRGLVSAAVCWQLLWFVVQPSLLPQAQPTPASAIAVAAVLALAVVLLLVHVIGRRPWAARIVRMNAVVILAATLVVNVSQARSPEPDWQRVAELAALAAGVTGLLLSTRWGLIGTGFMTALLLRDVVLPDWSGEFNSSVDAILDPVYVLAMGLSCVAAKRALLANADAADGAAIDLLRAEQERHTVDVVAQSLRDTERRLHESVLNTLVALARGGLGAQWGARISVRCEEGARLLESLSSRSAPAVDEARDHGSLEQDLAGVISDLQGSGVDVRWSAQQVDLPADVYSALRTAAAEALINVGRHADASSVDVDVTALRARGSRGVSLRIRDDGRGFPQAAVEERFGLTDAIAGPLAEVGGTAVVRSALGEGTDITLSWWSPRGASDGLDSALTPAASVLALPVLVVLALYASVMVIVTRGFITDPMRNGIAFSLWLVLVVTVVGLCQRRTLTWSVVVLVAAGGWMTYVLQESATPEVATAWWSSPAIAGLFLVVAAIGPSGGWILLLLTWLVLQGDPLGELTQPGTAIILVGALLGRSLRRNARLAWENRSAQAQAASATRDARAAIERIAWRYRPLQESGAGRLLRGVAEGRLDAGDPHVRAEAGREERFIRNVMRTDPADGPVQSLAAALAMTAHARRALLDLEVSREMPADLDLDASAAIWFTRAMENACATTIIDGRVVGSTARLTLRVGGDGRVLRLIVPMGARLDMESMDGTVRAQLIDSDDEAGEIWLWETDVRFRGVEHNAVGHHR